MNEFFTVVGIAVISAGFIVLLKQYKPEYAFGIAIAIGIILLFYSISFLDKIFEYVKDLLYLSEIPSGSFEILLKCFGICMLTKTASDTCKDCGQGSIASKVDFTGKIFILGTALPLFSEVINIVKNLINI